MDATVALHFNLKLFVKYKKKKNKSNTKRSTIINQH